MRKVLFAATCAAMATGAAQATVTTISGSFTATDWIQFIGSTPSPIIDPVYLEFTTTFDDALIYENSTTELTVLRTNFPTDLRFSYFPGGFIVLATEGISGGCVLNPGNFCALYANGSSSLPSTVYQAAETGAWVAATITPGVPGIPEPASWAMLIAGFGLVGAATRRRRRISVA